ATSRHRQRRLSSHDPTEHRTERGSANGLHALTFACLDNIDNAFWPDFKLRHTLPTEAARPATRSLTPPLWVRGGTCMSAGPIRSTAESIRRDRPARRSPAHAEAP